MSHLREHQHQTADLFVRRFTLTAGTCITAALVFVLGAADILTWGINLSILYIIPLLIYANTQRSRGFLVLGGLLIGLTYVKIVVWTPDLHLVTANQWLNRSLVALMLFVCTILLHRWRRFCAQWEHAGGPLVKLVQEGSLLGQSFNAMGRTVAVLIAIVLAGAIFATDLFTPRQINMPILYLVPMTLAVTALHGRATWIIAVCLIILAAGGYFCSPPMPPAVIVSTTQPLITFLWGSPPPRHQIFIHNLITNRAVACAVLLISAWALQRPRPSRVPFSPLP